MARRAASSRSCFASTAASSTCNDTNSITYSIESIGNPMITLALLFALFFDTIPSGWIALKDQKKVCQVGAPSDFKADPNFPGLAKGPGDAVEVAVFSSPSPVKPITESVGKMMGIEKFVDNSAARLFY